MVALICSSQQIWLKTAEVLACDCFCFSMVIGNDYMVEDKYFRTNNSGNWYLFMNQVTFVSFCFSMAPLCVHVCHDLEYVSSGL